MQDVREEREEVDLISYYMNPPSKTTSSDPPGYVVRDAPWSGAQGGPPKKQPQQPKKPNHAPLSQPPDTSNIDDFPTIGAGISPKNVVWGQPRHGRWYHTVLDTQLELSTKSLFVLWLLFDVFCFVLFYFIFLVVFSSFICFACILFYSYCKCIFVHIAFSVYYFHKSKLVACFVSTKLHASKLFFLQVKILATPLGSKVQTHDVMSCQAFSISNICCHSYRRLVHFSRPKIPFNIAIVH